jgi:hypothetical protein
LSDPDLPVAANLLDRQFTAVAPNHPAVDKEADLVAGFEVITGPPTTGEGRPTMIYEVKLTDRGRHVELVAKHFALLALVQIHGAHPAGRPPTPSPREPDDQRAVRARPAVDDVGRPAVPARGSMRTCGRSCGTSRRQCLQTVALALIHSKQ